jgi:hypothetical protein
MSTLFHPLPRQHGHKRLGSRFAAVGLCTSIWGLAHGQAISPQTITFPAQADQVLASPGDTFTIDPPATASSGLPVNYISHTPGICTVSGTTVTLLDAGTCTLEAQQPGIVGQWLAANGVRTDIAIRKPQAIGFPQQPDRIFVAGDSFTLDEPATASSGLPVAYAWFRISGQDRQIKAGNYELTTGLTPYVLLQKLARGEGLSPLARSHLFDAFWTTKPDGMGLGLNICRHMAEANGGRIWATDREDGQGGTVFHVTIACAPATDARPSKGLRHG